MNIRIVSPAGKIASEIVEKGAATLRSWGHNISVSPHANGEYGRFAGTPEDRLQDILDALRDPNVDAIYASRGGYGCIQFADKIPSDLIKASRKPIIGYSDITILHAVWQKSGVRSIHAHMMKALGEQPDSRSVLAIKNLIAASDSLDNAVLHLDLPDNEFNILPDIHVKGPIIGGNLAVLSGLHGTPLDFDYDGKILFIEDISESPYKVDRMMNQLRLCGVFNRIKALVVGQFTGCDEDPLMPKCLYATMHDMLLPYNIPVRFNAPIGHVDDNHPIVEGAIYEI